jgi:PAS domain S-box-containing protein
MNRTSALGIRTRVRLGFVTALVSLVMIGFIAQRRLQQSMEQAVWVNHTELVLDQLAAIAASLRTAESEERGFLLTGEQKLRESFRDAQQQTSTHLALLRRLTADNPRHEQRLGRLETLLKQVLRGDASAIARHQRGTTSGRPYTLASSGDKEAMQQIHSLFQEIEGEQKRLLRERFRDSSNSSAVVRAVVGAGSFLGAISVILCSLLVGRYLRRREQSEATLLEVQQGLEARALERASELGRLAASLRSEIAERQKTEEQLRESEQRYRLVAKAANGVIWDWDLISDQVHWNEDAQTLFGYSADEIDETWWRDRVHPEDRNRVAASIRAVVDGAAGHWSDEYRYRRAGGSYAEVLDRGYVVRDPEGKPVRMIGSMQRT